MTVCLLGTALGEDCWSLCPNMHCLHLCFMARWRWNSRALRRCQQWVGALFVLFLYWGHYFVLLYFPSFSLLEVLNISSFSASTQHRRWAAPAWEPWQVCHFPHPVWGHLQDVQKGCCILLDSWGGWLVKGIFGDLYVSRKPYCYLLTV